MSKKHKSKENNIRKPHIPVSAKQFAVKQKLTFTRVVVIIVAVILLATMVLYTLSSFLYR
ncbi:MAG: hypothetical protein OHK0017_10270 [Patescibacteria group bacterium]